MEQPTPNVPGADSGLKNKFVKSAVILLTVFLFIGGAAYVWQKWLSQGAIEAWKYGLYQKFYVDRYENAMREDVWGGKTPQETLDLFIEALKKDDIELASKYFALNTNENSEYYLTRDPKWLEGLSKTREQNGIYEVIQKISSVIEDKERITSSEDSKFKLINKNEVTGYIDLELNTYSGVWKIESM